MSFAMKRICRTIHAKFPFSYRPPVNPPKEIDDKDDKKPEDWDEREKIPDPDATKPDDWSVECFLLPYPWKLSHCANLLNFALFCG